MRIANLRGRAVLVDGSSAFDIERASGGTFGPAPQAVWTSWADFSTWATGLDVSSLQDPIEFTADQLEAPVPRPGQVFAIGLNYADHAVEAGFDVPENPVVFTKFPSCLTGPEAVVELSGDRVDWEAELVLVVGRGGRHLDESEAWDALAGVTVGQDLSDRTVQSWGKPAQFNLGKSFAGYGPTGPAVVTLDEIRQGHDVNALRIRCRLVDADGTEQEVLQDGTTADLIFGVPQLVSRLSAIVELRAGDLVFTGTPAGVGLGRTPPLFLKAGQRLETEIEGIGIIRQTFTATG